MIFWERSPPKDFQNLRKLTICEVHDNAQFSFLRLVDFDELNDVRVLECLQKPRLLQDLPFLLVDHPANVNLLHDTLQTVRVALHKVGFAVAALAE